VTITTGEKLDRPITTSIINVLEKVAVSKTLAESHSRQTTGLSQWRRNGDAHVGRCQEPCKCIYVFIVQLILPFVDVQLKEFDLSIQHRD
jgi:hypothetical protein